MSSSRFATWAAVLAFALILALQLLSAFRSGSNNTGGISGIAPQWEAIATWPGIESSEVVAMPNPNQQFTVIVLDDSGSMRLDLSSAKQAVISAVGAMAPEDRVAIVALNSGTVLPFMAVRDAQDTLNGALRPILADGSTPLTPAINLASKLLAPEAARARQFGTYRVLITTDGAADDPEALQQLIERLAATTPIQMTTIGINIGGEHVLRRDDLGRFVDVSNVAALGGALQAAVAENTSFAAITRFE